MSNFIMITYPSDSAAQIKVFYAVEQTQGMHMISCSVEERIPLWLQLRKFNLFSLRERNNYVPLFNELNNSRNMDTSLFIDLVYSTIMKLERCTLS